MALTAGSRIGVYEIVSLIGRGGMGEVYRARDTRLGREVAVKTLPADLVTDRDFLSRFEREARVLASLTHPNIAVIHGVEDGDPGQAPGDRVSALVMELVEGETLDDRIRRGPVPLTDALDIARQIADAIEAAHEKGIVHRDLKPANVKITPGGVVKVLDFGLAKSLAPGSHDGLTASVTGPAVLVGTPAYMAPEQIQGQPAGTGVDVWAFGVVLYEMLTGERPFTGRTVHETLAAVLTSEPDWDRVPPSVRPLVRACLERDPRKRLRSIGDHRFLLDPPASMPPPERRLTPAPMLLLAAVGIAAVALAFAAGRAARSDASARTTPIRLSTMLPVGASVTRGPGYTSSVAISPDGETVVIAASDTSGQRLYRRTLDRLDPVPLAGSERGSSPFFSWDGAWIGFFADGRLKRMPAAGGAAIDIAEAPGFPAGASWGPDDRIVFAYGADPALHVVSAQGGAAERLPHVTVGRHPEVLGDGTTVLYETFGRIHILNSETGRTKELTEGSVPRYAAGHVIFSRDTTLLARPIDLDTHEFTGVAVTIAEGVATELPGSAGGGHYSISRQGALAFVPTATTYSLVLVRENGIEQDIAEPATLYENPRFSPDGRSVVVAARQRPGEPANLWLHDLVTPSASRLTFDGGRAPVWGPDASTVTYSHLGDEQGIYTRRFDGSGEPRRLSPVPTFHWLVGWAPGGTLVYGAMDKATSSIIALGDRTTRTVVGPGSTWGGRLSKDGRWLAYYLLEKGTFNIYVQPFPEGKTRWLIAEGTDPAWGPGGREIFYRSGPRLMAARIDEGFRVLSRRVVIEPFLPPLYDDYDIHPDGRTLVVVRPSNRTQGQEITLVVGASVLDNK
jgi:serine/threonine-protein kinase